MTNIIVARTQQEAFDALASRQIDPRTWLKISHIHQARKLDGMRWLSEDDTVFIHSWPDNVHHVAEIRRALITRGWDGESREPKLRAADPTTDISEAVRTWSVGFHVKGKRKREQAVLRVSEATKAAIDLLPDGPKAKLFEELAWAASQFGLTSPVIIETYETR